MKSKYPLLSNIVIEAMTAEGKALAHVDGKVCFIPLGATGDVVDVQITCKKKRFLEGRIVSFVQQSPLRRKPACQHFGICGGCQWQHLPYKEQLQVKQQTVIDHLTRIGQLVLPEITPICGADNEFFYRNKLDYTFSPRRWFTATEMQDTNIASNTDNNALGFHVSGMFDRVLDIAHCHLQADPSNVIRLFVKDYALTHQYDFYDIKIHTGFLRNLMLRTASTGDVMVVVVFAYEDQSLIQALLEAIRAEFSQITSLMYVVNSKLNDSIADLEAICFDGDPFITEQMPAYEAQQPNLRFRIGPQSFYQTNSLQAANLYHIVADFANIQPHEVVYDLYTGAGTIAQYVARQAQHVVGIEYVASAVEDARCNAQLNGISNTSFFAGDIASLLTDEFVLQHAVPQVVITDPPRMGMHEKVIAQLLKIQPERIVYVSCNSATQARDIALMQELYHIERLQAVDMFPQTHHIENVVLLTKN
ncbi:23S rRNA (uracil-5-)-methyltransferase RumA [Bacteroidia bacterium]|nr:23S rRNA (uracil-5-)-methyltransferase RumA [Bacteroidia bacterium]